MSKGRGYHDTCQRASYGVRRGQDERPFLGADNLKRSVRGETEVRVLRVVSPLCPRGRTSE